MQLDKDYMEEYNYEIEYDYNEAFNSLYDDNLFQGYIYTDNNDSWL